MTFLPLLRRPPRARAFVGSFALGLIAASPIGAQVYEDERPASDVLDVVPPSAWVDGGPGYMSVRAPTCRSVPRSEVRRRIVDIALQEWVFFGTPVLDRVEGARLLPPGLVPDSARPTFENTTRRPRYLDEGESLRVAASIAGYWSVTPEGAGIVRSQNDTWRQRGIGTRWRAHWSAAFISWVMCEAGLGTDARFDHSIAHWRYIDQAIRARDGSEPEAAYVAHDIGERPVEPGDLLCSGRRPRYVDLAQRRRQMGTGASTHCDVVVHVDVDGRRILGVGGNVLRSVSLKVLPGTPAPDGGLLPRSTDDAPLFAHLVLEAEPVPAGVFVASPVLRAAACSNERRSGVRMALVLSRYLPAAAGPLPCTG